MGFWRVRWRWLAVVVVTVLGGSIMPPEVVAAWADASRRFVNLLELQDKVGARIAELVGGLRRAVVELVELLRIGVELADLAAQHVDHGRQLGPLLGLEEQLGERPAGLDVLGVERSNPEILVHRTAHRMILQQRDFVRAQKRIGQPIGISNGRIGIVRRVRARRRRKDRNR